MTQTAPKKLNQILATAICGNDIASSCLYVSALTIIYAGQYAWISLLIVGLVLYFFRKIYAEVVGAIPLNGGAYNVLLNTSTKRLASLAAVLTILSYMATAVISANEAMHYLSGIVTRLNVPIASITVLLFFSVLVVFGIGESARVALVIFIIHLITLFLLFFICVWYIYFNGFNLLSLNWNSPNSHGTITQAIFFGFCVAMLGISGFESSSNFVEEQELGVFPKTLRNMWAIVSFFNPLLAFLAICIVPIAAVGENKESFLAYVGQVAGGEWLATFISIDAVLVLCGAVLTSFIGVSGLLQRITLDRILPNYFLEKNKYDSNYRIVIAFFILCVSVLLATKGDLQALAGVYSFSFLAVMALFGIGNLLLKFKRKKLPRPVRARGVIVVLAVCFVLLAFAGNILLNASSFLTFIEYFLPAFLFIGLMLYRSIVIRFLIGVINYFYQPLQKFVIISNRHLKNLEQKINSQELVFFTKGDDVSILNRVMQYVEENEATKKLKIVNIVSDGKYNDHLRMDMEVLDRAYPKIEIEFLEINGVFGPEIIETLSKEWDIPKNFMFIGSPGNKFSYRVAELGGVRLIME